MRHDIKVTFHTHGQTPDSGRIFVEDAIKRHPGVNAINRLEVEHACDYKEMFKRVLPFLECFCEADSVGDADDNCGVLRAQILRNEIYFVLRDKRASNKPWQIYKDKNHQSKE